jgi:hypothetical protein
MLGREVLCPTPADVVPIDGIAELVVAVEELLDDVQGACTGWAVLVSLLRSKKESNGNEVGSWVVACSAWRWPTKWPCVVAVEWDDTVDADAAMILLTVGSAPLVAIDSGRDCMNRDGSSANRWCGSLASRFSSNPSNSGRVAGRLYV